MQEYEVRRQLKSTISLESIRGALAGEFGTVTEENGHLVVSYGGLSRLECWLNDKKRLCVITASRPDVSETEASETIGKYNRFLQTVTGYTSKERRKKAMKVE